MGCEKNLRMVETKQISTWQLGNEGYKSFKSLEFPDSAVLEKILNRKNINLDISARCTLECPRCRRAQYKRSGDKVPGHDISRTDFEKILKHFDRILFCGQVSDPTVHPELPYFLKRIYEERKFTTIAPAASHKPIEWYEKTFQVNPNAVWRFGVDGFPEESHRYRINQDGPKLFEVMKMGVSMGIDIEWQCIVFSYNEDHIEAIKQMAIDNGITFSLTYSSRWHNLTGYPDPYQPKNTSQYIGGDTFNETNIHTKKRIDILSNYSDYQKKLWNEELWLKESSLVI